MAVQRVLRIFVWVAAAGWLFGMLGCSSPPQCRESDRVGPTALNPNGSSCKFLCDCNNQTHEGVCQDGTCVAQERETCQVQGAKRPCQLRESQSSGCRLGVQICQPTYLVSMRWGDCEPVPKGEEKTYEACGDGVDNDCDGKVDNADEECKSFCYPGDTPPPCYGGPKESLFQGRCVPGTRACDPKTHQWATCEGEKQPVEETCNRQDDDCDGLVDEGIAGCPSRKCSPSEQRDCYTELTGCSNNEGRFRCRGICKLGYRTCKEDQSWSSCQRQVTPQNEICDDGYDNDCDGTIDEDCPCTAGQTQACYSGTPEESKQGSCRKGIQRCVRGFWGPCEGETRPKEEVCNGRDDDCDGSVDESLVRPDCPKQAGVCRGARAFCGGAAGWLPCDDQTYKDWDTRYASQEGTDACEGVDNDCNGRIDENCNTPACKPGEVQSCYSGVTGTAGVGVCQSGQQVCIAGLWSKCLSERLPGTESCDGRDEDCDGTVDEDATCPTGQRCENGRCTGSTQEQPTENTTTERTPDAGTEPNSDAGTELSPDASREAGLADGEHTTETTLDGTTGERATCSINSDCPTGQQCILGECKECARSSDCAAGQVCIQGSCVTGTCVQHSDCSGDQICFQNTCQTCSATVPCDTNFFCDNGQCKPIRCRLNSDCASGLVCDSTTKSCRSCTMDAECGSTARCFQGFCRQTCQQNSDCPSGICYNKSTCVVACKQQADCTTGHLCVNNACLATVQVHEGAYRWPPAGYAQNCTHYRHPPDGYLPAKTSGEYWIHPTGSKAPFRVLCDMTFDGGGWTLIAQYKTGIAYSSYNPLRNQKQATGTSASLSAPPNLLDPKTQYGHIDHSYFPIKDRELRLDCRTLPNGGWFRAQKQGLFNDWSFADKGTASAALGESPYRGPSVAWGIIGRKGIRTRHIHGLCGTTPTTTVDVTGIAFCNGQGRSYSWTNHVISFSFDSSSPYTDFVCNKRRISSGEGRVWVRDLSSNPPWLHQGARRWLDGSVARSCNEYRSSIGGQYTGNTGTGLYWIQPDPQQPAFQVLCDMHQRGGGWTLAFIKNSVSTGDFRKALTTQHNISQLLSAPDTTAKSTTYREAWLDLSKLPYTQFFLASYNRGDGSGAYKPSCNYYNTNTGTSQNGICAFALPILARSALSGAFGSNGYYLDKVRDVASSQYLYRWCGGDIAYGNGTACAPAQRGMGAGWYFFQLDGNQTPPSVAQSLWVCGQGAQSCDDMFRGFDSTGKVAVRKIGNAGSAIAIWVR